MFRKNNRFNDKELREGQELAKEFSSYESVHKLSIIQVGLIMCHDTIYDNKLLRKYKSLNAESPTLKSEMVIEDLYENENLLNEVYLLCWEQVKDILPDNTTFN